MYIFAGKILIFHDVVTDLYFSLLKNVGSPVLGYLAAGILIGTYGLSIIRYVHGTKAIAEFGVVFLLFNIGLEVEQCQIWSSIKCVLFTFQSICTFCDI